MSNHFHIDFSNLNKIRLKNSDKENFIFHDTVKTILVKLILLKYHSTRRHQIIYTEYPINSRIVDIYHYNHLTKEEICYEIQSKISKSWVDEVTNHYKNLDIDLIVIDLNKLNKNIPKLIKELKELVV